jgi:hypothetical protein
VKEVEGHAKWMRNSKTAGKSYLAQMNLGLTEKAGEVEAHKMNEIDLTCNDYTVSFFGRGFFCFSQQLNMIDDVAI